MNRHCLQAYPFAHELVLPFVNQENRLCQKRLSFFISAIIGAYRTAAVRCPERKKAMDPNMTKKKYSVPSTVLYFYRYAYSASPVLARLDFLCVLCGILTPFLGILMPGVVLDMVQRGSLAAGLTVIAGAGLLMAACKALTTGVSQKLYFYENDLRARSFVSDVVLKGLRCRYEYVESEEGRALSKRVYERLLYGDSAFCYRILDIPRELLVQVVCFFLYSTILSTLSPWILLLLTAMAFLDYLIFLARNRWQLALRREFAQSDREIGYLNGAFRNPGLSKDARIFSMHGWLMDLRDKIFADRVHLEKRQNRKMILASLLQLLLRLVRNAVAYLYLIQAVLQGQISAAAFLVYIGAISGFSGFVTGIINHLSDLKLVNEDACAFRAYMDLPETDQGGEVPEALCRQPAKIEFRDVSFSYGDHPVYEHFNLTIQPGEKIALLGVNGAGKTTLVKLLCGLYEPQGGQILINGVDTATLPKKALYQLFSMVFQDPVILPYPLGSNLSFRRPEETDESRAWEALAQAGLKDFLEKEKIDLDSYMTRTAFDHGVELSGGQKQRLLLARAIYKNGNILILDEPTAALDPIAESEIYQAYADISAGRTSLFISHRLASTRFADRILFLENGKVVEDGSHEQLLALGGSYAHMFEVQSHYYKKQPDGHCHGQTRETESVS